MNRVAVTGAGVICGAGRTFPEFLRSLRQGSTGIRPVEITDMSHFRFKNGAEVRNYSSDAYFDPKQADMLDRFAQFGIIAAREAVRSAGIEWTDELRENTAIVTGSCLGGQTTEDKIFEDVYRAGSTRVHPMTIPKTMANAAASQISMEFGITGPAYTVSTACASSGHAIGQAFWMVRSGAARLAIAGGSEAPFSFGLLKAWEAMRVVSPDTCRPFSRDRSGMILGEGAAMLILEPWDAAVKRGVAILAEIAGFGMSSDAAHITQPSTVGPARAMRSALADARMNPDEVTYINAHGTATLANDPSETRSIREVFTTHAAKLAVSSTKAIHGHALGAGAALEAAACIAALRHGFLPPTVNYREPDPECDLDVVPNAARAHRVRAALSNSFAFGGLNAVLAFRTAHTSA